MERIRVTQQCQNISCNSLMKYMYLYIKKILIDIEKIYIFNFERFLLISVTAVKSTKQNNL